MRYTIDDLQDIIDNAKNTKLLNRLRKQEVVVTKKKCGLKVAIIVLTALAVLSAVAYFVYNYLSSDDTDPEIDFDDDFDEEFFEDDEESDDEEDDEV
ncbi:MAG: hypothetical protein MJ110_05460 [Lachnospiraceae bacterium]|nr:hypothetical protein [Lachnospiraceae bacterium]